MIAKARQIIEAGITFSTTTEARGKLESIIFCKSYAEPGHDDPTSGLIVIGDFSPVTVSPISAVHLIGSLPIHVVDDSPERVAFLLEEVGVELLPQDEWAICDACGRAVRTNSDSTAWKQNAWTDMNCDFICGDCVSANSISYLEWHEDRADRCLTIDGIDPTDHGYVVVESFVHGLHPGQDASPKLIAKAIRQQGILRFLFRLDRTSQHDIYFSLFIHSSESFKLDLDAWKSASKNAPSLSEQDRLAALDAPVQLNQISKVASWPPRNGVTKPRLYTPAQQQPHEEHDEPNTD
jgi:hypothetical protein